MKQQCRRVIVHTGIHTLFADICVTWFKCGRSLYSMYICVYVLRECIGMCYGIYVYEAKAKSRRRQ